MAQKGRFLISLIFSTFTPRLNCAKSFSVYIQLSVTDVLHHIQRIRTWLVVQVANLPLFLESSCPVIKLSLRRESHGETENSVFPQQDGEFSLCTRPYIQDRKQALIIRR